MEPLTFDQAKRLNSRTKILCINSGAKKGASSQSHRIKEGHYYQIQSVNIDGFIRVWLDQDSTRRSIGLYPWRFALPNSDNWFYRIWGTYD